MEDNGPPTKRGRTEGESAPPLSDPKASNPVILTKAPLPVSVALPPRVRTWSRGSLRRTELVTPNVGDRTCRYCRQAVVIGADPRGPIGSHTNPYYHTACLNARRLEEEVHQLVYNQNNVAAHDHRLICDHVFLAFELARRLNELADTGRARDSHW